MKKYLILFLLTAICFAPVKAQNQEGKEYKASLFGIESNGTTLNTRSIQKAIDYIHENGGGTLVFDVGRYRTGSIQLKSNVTIFLRDGAVLLGSTNPYDYDACEGWLALVYAKGAENIGLIGRGVVDGQGRETAYKFVDQIQKGLIKDDLGLDRPTARPTLLYLRECKDVTVTEVFFKNSAFWTTIFDQCKNLSIDKITVDSKNYWNNDGVDIVDCDGVKMTNSYIDASDDAICFKSHDPNAMCQNIEIRNCTARSSASGVKFGTVSRGGFKNIHLHNIKVFDTFRSAFTVQAVDGAQVENVTIDSLFSYNTGNVIYLRIGDRWSEGKPAYMKNISISNVYAEIPAGKPDAGYEYEGPVKFPPRNISPCGIVGMKDNDIVDVKLKNVTIVYPGGGNPNVAKAGATPADLDAIPEMEKSYPEFSQFNELPAWGFFIRHAKGVVFDNVTLTAQKSDYRPAIVLVDVKDSNFKKTKINEPGKKKDQYVIYKSTGIKK